jgi:hypothetical protein
MNSQKRTPYFLILSLLVAGYFSISPAAKAANASTGSSEEVSRLLAEVKTEAIALERDTDDLAAWTRAKRVSWQGHAGKLTLIREHINKAGQLLTELNEAREGASPWQHQAIDRIYPLLKELADNTEATIKHFNDNTTNIHHSAYSDYAKAGADLAQEIAALVSDYVDYGDHEAEFHRLQDKLNPASS